MRLCLILLIGLLALAPTTMTSCSHPAGIEAASAPRCRDVLADQFLGQAKPVLYVADVQKSAPFFRDALGFTFLSFDGEENDPFYAEMAAGSLKFALHEPTDEWERAIVGKQRLYFRVRDVETQRNRVKSCGAEAGEIIETSYMTMFSVTDLDGHEIVFGETDHPAVHSYDPW